MMGQFIEDILNVWTDDPEINAAKAKVREGSDSYMTFVSQVSPFSQKLMAKDSSFFCEENEFAKSLNLHIHWHEESCKDSNKAAIWQWLSSLYMISITLNMFPPEALSQIEAVAESCAKNIKPGNNLDIMSGMNSMLASMLSGGSGFPGMIPQTPRKKGNKKSR